MRSGSARPLQSAGDGTASDIPSKNEKSVLEIPLLGGICLKCLNLCFEGTDFFPRPSRVLCLYPALLSVSLLRSSPQFAIFQRIVLDGVGQERMAFQWCGAPSSTRELFFSDGSSQ